MPSTIQDLLIGLITSVIAGFAVWFWERFRRTLDLTQKSSFFGIRPEGNCLVVMNHNPRGRDLLSHGDVETVVEIVKIIYEINGEVTIAAFDKALEPPGDITEFCIGSPASNERTEVHIKNFMQDIINKPYSKDKPDSLAILTAGEVYRYRYQETEYAILAKIVPEQYAHPVFLVSGQSSRGNKASIYFLAKNYRTVLRNKYKYNSFCLLLRIREPKIYGYKSVELVKDLTDTVLIEEVRQNSCSRSATQKLPWNYLLKSYR
ncbi:MAG: hypothetical protein AAFY26_10510 [Cyanobacteria bacterium J06638_22]